jgi:hypothetical protein
MGESDTVPVDAADLPLGTEVTIPGCYGHVVKYGPDRWARVAFDYDDEFVTMSIAAGGTVKPPTAQPPATAPVHRRPGAPQPPTRT